MSSLIDAVLFETEMPDLVPTAIKYLSFPIDYVYESELHKLITKSINVTQ